MDRSQSNIPNELQIQLCYRISLRYTKAEKNVHTYELEFSLYLSPLGVLILKIIQPEFCSFESKKNVFHSFKPELNLEPYRKHISQSSTQGS